MQTLFERLLVGVVEALRKSGHDVEESFVAAFRDIDSEMAEEIENRMGSFEDIAKLDDRAVQMVLKEIEQTELAKALKGASAEIQDKIYRNMSKAGKAQLIEEMEYMGPVRRSDVEENQQLIASIIRKLSSAGKITIASSPGEELIF